MYFAEVLGLEMHKFGCGTTTFGMSRKRCLDVMEKVFWTSWKKIGRQGKNILDVDNIGMIGFGFDCIVISSKP